MVFTWISFLCGYVFENIRGHLCLNQSQALPNENLQMCRERIVVH